VIALKIAVYPGSFDPITCGHLDIIKRSCKLFDKVIVAVLDNSQKTPLFSVAERIQLIKKCTKEIPNCEVESFGGLLVDFVKQSKAHTVIRGLRAISDFEYEFQMAMLNKKLAPDVETVFMVTNLNCLYISSSVVKEICRFGGNADGLIPEEIIKDITDKIEKGV
jgi:pantetheine-phosphate adenylyltransferase